MKTLRQKIFAFAMVIGLALSVSAQGDDQKKPPKKPKPPVIDPAPKQNPPKGDKPKKPGSAFYPVSVNRNDDIV